MRTYLASKLSWIYLLAAIFLWSLTGATGRNLRLPTPQLLFLLFLSCTALATPGLIWLRLFKKSPRSKKSFYFKNSYLIVLVGSSFYLLNYCYFEALKLGSATTAISLLYTGPLWVTLYSFSNLAKVKNKELILPVKLKYIGLCFLGIVFLISDSLWPRAPGLLPSIDSLLWGFLGGLSFAAYSIWSEKLYSSHNQEDSYRLFTSTVVVAAILSLLVFLPDFESLFSLDDYGRDRGLTLISFLGMSLLISLTCLFLPFLFYSKALRKIPVLTASLVTLAEPSLNVFFVYLTDGEVPSQLAAIGAAVILISLSFLLRLNK